MSLSAEKYEIKGSLGGGSFGEVFLVRHKHIDRDKAAKIIKTTNFYEALKEAKTIQTLQNDNIIHIYDADILPDKSGIFITMEHHLLGSTVKSNFVSRQKLMEIAIHILRALEHAHGKEFIHRDIKPNNILLNKHHKAILTDFGLSAKINEIANAPQYRYRYHIAPEVLSGKGEENAKTDLYALGVTMHRLINGDPAYLETIRSVELEKRIASGEYPDRSNYRPDIPANIAKVINKALNINPIRRYQTAHEMLKDIERKALPIHDWLKSKNRWHSTMNHINFQIEIEKNGSSRDIITSKKRIDSHQFRRIKEHCFYGICATNVDDAIRSVISEIDSRFEI